MAYGFFWYELGTPDIDGAIDFYSHVVGWTTQEYPASEGMQRYAVVQAGDRGVGGIGANQPGTPPAWTSYIRSADVDSAAKDIVAAGGKVLYGPDDIPTVGRFAVVADPQGAVFKLLNPDGPDQPPVAPYTPGHVGWNELHTTDSAAAIEFYGNQFGWTHARDHDMGPMGAYRIFAVNGEDGGGMFNSPVSPPAFWLPYFHVEEIHAGTERIKDRGGKIMMGPHEVPGGGWIVQGQDPQGVFFALTGPAKD